MIEGIRQIFQSRRESSSHPKHPTSIISVVNQKGGCGKTTTCINVASGLAKRGFKVLVIDLDPQANCSLGLGIGVHNVAFSSYDIVVGQLDLERAIVPTYDPGLDIIPATSKLTGAQLEIADLLGREGLLRTAIYRCLSRGIKHYDYILLDCSPSLNLITLNGLVASKYVLTPIQPHYFSLEGMSELFTTIDVVRNRLNSELEILGILVTFYYRRSEMNRNVLSQIQNYFKEKVFQTSIQISPPLIESTAYGKSVLDFEPSSVGAQEYRALADEVIQRTRASIIPAPL